jgi:hypothetical protein
MKIDKKAINYYYSFFEVSKELNQKQFYELVHIDSIEFKDTMLTILWKSVKHSLQASIKGYCDKKAIPYDEVFTPLSDPHTKPLDNNDNRTMIIDNDKEQCIISKGKKEFTFSLSKDTHFSNLSKEYVDELNKYIVSLHEHKISFEDFRDSCLAKNSYKYKNFKLTYNKWNKKADNKPISFKEQDRQRTAQIADVVLTQGHNPFNPSNYQSQEEFTDVQLTN